MNLYLVFIDMHAVYRLSSDLVDLKLNGVTTVVERRVYTFLVVPEL